MNQLLRFLILLSLVLLYVNCRTSMTLQDYDLKEIQKISVYNRSRLSINLSPIFMNENLNKIAIQEAQRLAQLGELEFPEISQMQTFFRGYSVKVTGISNNKHIGDKLCFQRGQNLNDLVKILNIDTKCDTNVDWHQDYYFGYGASFDSHKNIYSVRIYTPQSFEQFQSTTVASNGINNAYTQSMQTTQYQGGVSFDDGDDDEETDELETEIWSGYSSSAMPTNIMTTIFPSFSSSFNTWTNANQNSKSKQAVVSSLVALLNSFKNNNMQINDAITNIIKLFEQ